MILDEFDYKDRMGKMIEDEGYEMLKSNSLNSMKNQMNEKHGDTMCSEPKKELKKWKVSNPQVPRYPKDHNGSEQHRGTKNETGSIEHRRPM